MPSDDEDGVDLSGQLPDGVPADEEKTEKAEAEPVPPTEEVSQETLAAANAVADAAATDTPEPETKEADVTAVDGEPATKAPDRTTEQQQAFDRLVADTRGKYTAAVGGVLLAHWHLGDAAKSLRDDVKKNHGSVYGHGTVEEFAARVGRGRATVYKAIKFREVATRKQVDALAKSGLMELQHLERFIKGNISSTTQKEIIQRIAESAPSIDEVAQDNVEAEEPVSSQQVVNQIIDEVIEEKTGSQDGEEAGAGSGTSASGEKTTPKSTTGTNTSTGRSHLYEIKRFLSKLEDIQVLAGTVTISFGEMPKDTDITDKGQEKIDEQIELLMPEIDNAAKTLDSIKALVTDHQATAKNPDPEK